MHEVAASGKEHYGGTKPDLRFGSNAVRLSVRQWIAAGIIIVAALLLAPTLWERLETFQPDADYRIPYALSSDYWLFDRYCRLASARPATLVVGDSVIWGHYVTQHQTLSHYLNDQAGKARFVNLGVDGVHPAAMAGLLEYYGRGISKRNVILHCNLLWTASSTHDLQTQEDLPFSHPSLVPQFVPRIPRYAESFNRRLGIAIERRVEFCSWAEHLRLVYFDSADLPAWTTEHPYANPFRRIALPTDGYLPQDAIPWTRKGIKEQAFPWVELETSLQWRLFRQAAETLQRRGNRVFVLVGPFNTHMLTLENRRVYALRKRKVEEWLVENDIPHYVAPELDTELYADASHPLSAGYAVLAKQLFEHDSFARFDAPCRGDKK